MIVGVGIKCDGVGAGGENLEEGQVFVAGNTLNI